MTNGEYYKTEQERKDAFKAFCKDRVCEGCCEAFAWYNDIAMKHGIDNPTCIVVWEQLQAPVSEKG